MKRMIFLLFSLMFIVNISAIGVHDPPDEVKTQIVNIEKADIVAATTSQDFTLNQETFMLNYLEMDRAHISVDQYSFDNTFYVCTTTAIQDKTLLTDYTFNDRCSKPDSWRFNTFNSSGHLDLKLSNRQHWINDRSHIPDNWYLSIRNNTAFRMGC